MPPWLSGQGLRNYLCLLKGRGWNDSQGFDFFPIFPNFNRKYHLSPMFGDIQILNINKVGSELVLQGGQSHLVFCGLLLFLCAKKPI